MNKGLKIALIAGICVLLVGVVASCYKNDIEVTNTYIENAKEEHSEFERFRNNNFSYPYVIDFSYSKVVSTKAGTLEIPIYKDALLTEAAYLSCSGSTSQVNFYLYDVDADISGGLSESSPYYQGKITNLGVTKSINNNAIRYSYFSYKNALFRIDWGQHLETMFDYFASLMARYNNSSNCSGNITESFYCSFNSGLGPNGAGYIMQSKTDYLSIYNNNTWQVVTSVHDSGWFELLFHDTIEFSVDYTCHTTDGIGSGGSGGGAGGGGGGSW